MMDRGFWEGKRVFLTGHTGFKGSWLCLWLTDMGAKVTGYSLLPATKPSLFEICQVDQQVHSIFGDIRDLELLKKSMAEADPEVVIHMAAQPLVRESYVSPVETYATNVMGTVHLFEAARACKNIKSIVNVTTDKCYENKEWVWGYREDEPLGGYDPYSNSKACSELVTSSYRNSFFNPRDYSEHRVGVASARAGNVIGGGDWAPDRLVPDIIRSLINDEPIVIRNPNAIRPWQHVLEPLSGYLLLAQKLYENGIQYAEGWNFGPNDEDAKPVEWIVFNLRDRWGNQTPILIDNRDHPHEATYLKLDCSKAKAYLDWAPRWDLDVALAKVVEWAAAYQKGDNVKDLCIKQIHEYESRG